MCPNKVTISNIVPDFGELKYEISGDGGVPMMPPCYGSGFYTFQTQNIYI